MLGDIDRIINTNIKRIRMEAGVTQDYLADKIGTSKQTISNYEAGRSRASASTLYAMAKALNTSVLEFYP